MHSTRFNRWVLVCLVGMLSGAPQTGAAVADVSVEEQARRELLAHLTEQLPHVTHFVIEPLADSHLVLHAEQIRDVVVSSAGARSAVRVTFVDATRLRAKTLWFDVHGLGPALATTRNVAPRSPLTADDVVLTELDLLTRRCVPVTGLAQLSNTRTARAVRVGEPICPQDIEPRPAVARGDTVLVRYASQRIALTTKGIAGHDAAIGQRVAIRTPGSHESFVAEVTAEREVSVHEGL